MPHSSSRKKQRISTPDAELQKILTEEVGCNYELLPHQFIAVRSCAGVTKDFPFSNGVLCKSDLHKLLISTPGMILADTMGLGKTVVGVASMMLRNHIDSIKGEECLPTLIVGPNDAVLDQWKETLLHAGVTESRIHVMKRKFEPSATLNQRHYILFNRYKLQSEVKRLMESSYPKSPLFPHVEKSLITKLHNCYLSDKGKAKAKYRFDNETNLDCATRLISKVSIKPIYQSVIIDEAHFHRNLLAYWGLGAALLGLHCQRTILLTGTPYNNDVNDLVALMNYIDPSHEASRSDWWTRATSQEQTDSIVTFVKEWRETFLLRRGKEVLRGKIPSKTISSLEVDLHPFESEMYELYEHIFLENWLCAKEFNSVPQIKTKWIKIEQIMIQAIQCMRMSLIHPVLPGGREVTKYFSPTRNHLRNKEENPYLCVCCNTKHGIDDSDLSNYDLNDNCLDEENYEHNKSTRFKRLTVIDSDFCLVTNSSCRHYACSDCLKELREIGNICPKCSKLKDRLQYSGHKYCKTIETPFSDTPGFTVSAKLKKVVNWIEKSVQHEKAIITSFFKGGLDLLEGILHYDLKIGYARYDGDFPSEQRALDLKRFKTCKDTKVLLMTIQSGGTGLNIVEANNMLFLDRWFNPCVHEQAEDRCWRIGQRLPVKIQYLDCPETIDTVMKEINQQKSNNSKVLLADGTDIGSNSKISYKDLTGYIGYRLMDVRRRRGGGVSEFNIETFESEQHVRQSDIKSADNNEYSSHNKWLEREESILPNLIKYIRCIDSIPLNMENESLIYEARFTLEMLRENFRKDPVDYTIDKMMLTSKLLHAQGISLDNEV